MIAFLRVTRTIYRVPYRSVNVICGFFKIVFVCSFVHSLCRSWALVSCWNTKMCLCNSDTQPINFCVRYPLIYLVCLLYVMHLDLFCQQFEVVLDTLWSWWHTRRSFKYTSLSHTYALTALRKGCSRELRRDWSLPKTRNYRDRKRKNRARSGSPFLEFPGTTFWGRGLGTSFRGRVPRDKFLGTRHRRGRVPVLLIHILICKYIYIYVYVYMYI